MTSTDRRLIYATQPDWQRSQNIIRSAQVRDPAIGRRVNTLCTHKTGLRQQLAVFQVYHNFCLPHASLRLVFAAPELIVGTGGVKKWHQRTPAMAAGLTNQVWNLREVLMYRVPPWPQPQGG